MARRALMQATQLGSDGLDLWTISYDRKQDVLSWRREDQTHPAIAYYVPSKPLVLLLVEVETDRLVGIDMQRFRSQIVKENRKREDAFKSWWRSAA